MWCMLAFTENGARMATPRLTGEHVLYTQMTWMTAKTLTQPTRTS